MNREQFDTQMYVKPTAREEREARSKANTRRFWFLCVPGGALAAFVVALLSGSGDAFFFAWAVFTFVGYGMSVPEGK